MDNWERLEQLAGAIQRRNAAADEIAQVIGRPALIGHTGEYLAEKIFGIDLEPSAAQKGIDGRFAKGALAGRTVNIKWYGKMEGLLNISLAAPPDFYLVMTGPKAQPASSRGTIRPWLISYIFLFDAKQLVRELNLRQVKMGIATSIAGHLWEMAEIYPVQRSNQLMVSDEQKKLLALFSKS